MSLGLVDGLFAPASAKAQVLFNSGLMAPAWLALGAVLIMLIRRFSLPGPRRAPAICGADPTPGFAREHLPSIVYRFALLGG